MATYEKRNGNWRVKVRRRGHSTLTRSFDRKAEAQSWAREIERDMARGEFVSRKEAESTTLYEAFDRYAREITPQKKSALHEANRIANLKKTWLAQRSLAEIRGVDLARYRDERRRDVAANTVRLDLALISHLYNIARTEWGMESLSNPVRNTSMPRLPRGRDRRLEGDEDVRLLKAVGESQLHWLKPIVELAIETAMRQGEILGLKWPDINLERRVARLSDTKNGESRSVPLSSRAITILEALPRSIQGRLFPVTQAQIEHAFRRACMAAKIEGLRFHDLRHEGTSRLFERGLDMMEVATITGHKTLQMLKRYTHLRAYRLAEKLG